MAKIRELFVPTLGIKKGMSNGAGLPATGVASLKFAAGIQRSDTIPEISAAVAESITVENHIIFY
jgi:hypothetical protein